MSRVAYALKGAVADLAQLEARAAALVEAGLPVILELHTFGTRDVDTHDGRAASRETIARLRARVPVERLILHVPVQTVDVVTRAFFDVAQCDTTLRLAAEIGAEAVVLHRYGALVTGDQPARGVSKAAADEHFLTIVADLARRAQNLRILVENIGHYSLLPRDGRSYLIGPLDHFFPWEIAAFREACAARGLANVEPFVDVAHATLSSNLFNRERARGLESQPDPRAAWIDESDLAQAERLHPFDFVDAQMRYLHVSDAVLLEEAEIVDPALPEARIVEAIVSEGLEIGTGNLPFERLAERLGPEVTLVVEVEPGAGESHVENGAQVRSLQCLRDLLARSFANASGNP